MDCGEQFIDSATYVRHRYWCRCMTVEEMLSDGLCRAPNGWWKLPPVLSHSYRFFDWLMSRRSRDNRTGDLADDVMSDVRLGKLPESVRQSNEQEIWRAHLRNQRACDAAQKTLAAAFQAWRKQNPGWRDYWADMI